MQILAGNLHIRPSPHALRRGLAVARHRKQIASVVRLSVLAAVCVAISILHGAAPASAENIQSHKIRLDATYERSENGGGGGASDLDLAVYSLDVGVDVVQGPFLYGGSIGPRRTRGRLGVGAAATDIRANGGRVLLYGAWSPHPPVYVGLAVVGQRDEGVFETPFGNLDSTLTAGEIRPFLLAFLPVSGGSVRAGASVEYIHGRLEVATAQDTVFTDINGLAELAVTSPPISGVTAEASVEVRHIFQQDVLFGGTPRSPWSARFGVSLATSIGDGAELSLSGSLRAFDQNSNDQKVLLRLERTF